MLVLCLLGRKHAAAVLPLRAAVAALDGEIAGVPANKGSEGERWEDGGVAISLCVRVRC